jgi:cysteine-rich repeat protein
VRSRRFWAAAVLLLAAGRAHADDVPRALPFLEDWTDTSRIDQNNDWSHVPGVLGRRGNNLITGEGVDPQSVLTDGGQTMLSVLANKQQLNGEQGALAELEAVDPMIAMQANQAADAPHLLLYVDTRGATLVHVAYDLVDLDNGDDNVTPVALQYRVAGTATFTNVPAGFVADATTSGAGAVTHVGAALPAEAAGHEVVIVRILTTNQPGQDEWVGIDDVAITAGVSPTGTVALAPTYGPTGTAIAVSVDVTAGTQPPSTGLAVRCDGAAIGAGSVELAQSSAHVFSGTLVAGVAPAGAHDVVCEIRDAQSRATTAAATFEVTPVCGDGRIEVAEVCDDGNGAAGDGCTACAVDAGWQCGAEPSVCVDINECEINHDDCEPAEICTNIPGGWTCTAPEMPPPPPPRPDAGVEMPDAEPGPNDTRPPEEPPPEQSGCSTSGGGSVLLALLALLALQPRSSRMRRAASRKSS